MALSELLWSSVPIHTEGAFTSLIWASRVLLHFVKRGYSYEYFDEKLLLNFHWFLISLTVICVQLDALRFGFHLSIVVNSLRCRQLTLKGSCLYQGEKPLLGFIDAYWIIPESLPSANGGCRKLFLVGSKPRISASHLLLWIWNTKNSVSLNTFLNEEEKFRYICKEH
jgi:hypothetical protein